VQVKKPAMGGQIAEDHQRHPSRHTRCHSPYAHLRASAAQPPSSALTQVEQAPGVPQEGQYQDGSPYDMHEHISQVDERRLAGGNQVTAVHQQQEEAGDDDFGGYRTFESVQRIHL
jgi:hypothetical protein